MKLVVEVSGKPDKHVQDYLLAEKLTAGKRPVGG
jgi:hypothetical protein